MRLTILLMALVVVVVGFGLFRYLRYMDFMNRYACADNSGSWVEGRCQHQP